MTERKRASILLRKEFFPSEAFAEQYTKISIKNTKKTMVNTHQIPDTIYHFTRKENAESILKEGLKAGLDGGVFVSTSLEESLAHLMNNVIEVDGFIHPFTQEILPNEEKLEDYIIIEGRPVGTYRKNWLAYLNKQHCNQYTLFYLNDILKLESVKIHQAINLI